MKSRMPSLRLSESLLLIILLIVGVFTTVAVQPVNTEAAGNAADLMCLPSWNYNCPCGVACQKPKDPRPGGKGCPCFDVTSGFTTPGTCVAAIKCQASSPEGMPPMLPMIPMPMPMPDQDPCASGAGGASRGIVEGASTSTNTASSTCPTADSSSFNSFPNYDTSAFNANTSGTGDTTGVSNLISSLLNGNVTADGPTGGSAQAGGSIVPGAATATVPRAPFGSANGVSGDVQVQGIFARVLASNRDTARNTQVSGFYGFQVADGTSVTAVFKNLCSLRPWSTNFISFIVPSSYFDALCAAHNLTGAAASATGGTTSTAAKTTTTSTAKPKIGAVDAAVGVNYDTRPSSGSVVPAAPKEYLGKARVDIWATPPSIAKGERTSIFWDTTGVYTCSISSSDRAFNGSSLSGHASTQTLSQNTTFSIACQTATSTVSNQVVVTVK